MASRLPPNTVTPELLCCTQRTACRKKLISSRKDRDSPLYYWLQRKPLHVSKNQVLTCLNLSLKLTKMSHRFDPRGSCCLCRASSFPS